jgi:hypothetical protein
VFDLSDGTYFNTYPLLYFNEIPICVASCSDFLPSGQTRWHIRRRRGSRGNKSLEQKHKDKGESMRQHKQPSQAQQQGKGKR